MAVTIKRVPVTIGLQTDKETEITSGLVEGEQVITKKITSAGGTSAGAPSITSLLRPQGQRAAGTSGTARPQ